MGKRRFALEASTRRARGVGTSVHISAAKVAGLCRRTQTFQCRYILSAMPTILHTAIWAPLRQAILLRTRMEPQTGMGMSSGRGLRVDQTDTHSGSVIVSAGVPALTYLSIHHRSDCTSMLVAHIWLGSTTGIPPASAGLEYIATAPLSAGDYRTNRIREVVDGLLLAPPDIPILFRVRGDLPVVHQTSSM